MTETPWPTIHAERKGLADDLARLGPGDWTTPSWCTGWSVHEVLGHLVSTAKKTPSRFFAGLLGAGFVFNRMSARDVARETAQGPAATLAEWRRLETATSSPPGPVDSWLGEVIVHSEDIRRPLGLVHEYPAPAVVRCLDFYKKSNLLIGAKSRVAGLRLRATDSDWSYGDGDEVAGPGLSLLLAMTGRVGAVADLSGEGIATLHARCTPKDTIQR